MTYGHADDLLVHPDWTQRRQPVRRVYTPPARAETEAQRQMRELERDYAAYWRVWAAERRRLAEERTLDPGGASCPSTT